MNTSMELIEKALKVKKAAEWNKQLGLSNAGIDMAKKRGKLSPAIAFALAEEMGEKSPELWALIAAAESERDSECKERMKKKLAQRLASSVFGGNGGIRTKLLEHILPFTHQSKEVLSGLVTRYTARFTTLCVTP